MIENYDNCGIDEMMAIMTIITVLIDNGNNMNSSNNDNQIKIKYCINNSKMMIRNTIITKVLIITVTNIGDSRRKKSEIDSGKRKKKELKKVTKRGD